ncbi:MAG TPA: MauE/DoxX family redox-associated membrane protein [Ktedonobacterales bacterium]
MTVLSAVAYALALYFTAVLGISGLSKVAEPARFREALDQQGFWPFWIRPYLGVVIPCAEVGLAFLLLTGWSQLLVGGAVLALLAAFLGLKIVLYATKSEADCGCSISAKRADPVDLTSVLVSSMLVLGAMVYLGLVVYGASPLPPSWRAVASVVFAVGALAILGSLTLQHIARIRYQARVESAPPMDVGGLPSGSQAPTFTALDTVGRSVSLSEYLGYRVVLAFISPGCPACENLLKTLRNWDRGERQADTKVIVVGGANDTLNRVYARRWGIPVLTPERDLRDEYAVRGTPHVYALDEQGVVRDSGGVVFLYHLRGLLCLAFEQPDGYGDVLRVRPRKSWQDVRVGALAMMQRLTDGVWWTRVRSRLLAGGSPRV